MTIASIVKIVIDIIDMKKILLVIAAALLSSAMVQAQEVATYSGVEELRAKILENPSNVVKYNELKKIYNYKEYTATIDDKYSPGLSGVASFFIPGLGQVICNEVGRGLGFFFGSEGAVALGTAVMMTGIVYDYEGNISSVRPGAALAGLALYAGAAALDIISIVDGVRVAKVKNMHMQDIKNSCAFDVKLYPSFDYAMVGSTYQPTAGLTMAVRF